MYTGFKVTTKVIITNDNDELLLLKNKDYSAHNIIIDLPGGTLETDEPIDECVYRELKEEIGWEISLDDLKLLNVFVVNRINKPSLVVIVYVLNNSYNIDQTITLSEEHSDYLYANQTEIEQIREASVIFEIIDYYYKTKKFT